MPTFKPAHLAAFGSMLVSIVGVMATWPDWSPLTKPAGVAAIAGAIGATLIAMFSEKPRDLVPRDRWTDPPTPPVPPSPTTRFPPAAS